MPKTKAQKEVTLQKLEKDLKEVLSVIFVRQDGLTASEEVALRKSLREEKVEYGIVKKTLLTKALASQGFKGDVVKSFTGTIAAAYGKEDEVAPAKILNTFSKEHKVVKFLGGIVSGSFMSAEETTAFAQLPSKKELLGQLVSVVAGPLRGLVNVVQGNLKNLIFALKAIEEQKK
ncbi:50S ribosomal protein L10 [Patescibacteria group bacterium]